MRTVVSEYENLPSLNYITLLKNGIPVEEEETMRVLDLHLKSTDELTAVIHPMNLQYYLSHFHNTVPQASASSGPENLSCYRFESASCTSNNWRTVGPTGQ